MKQPIGIFDSGVGGLTVFKEVRKKFPYEDIIYFGDTARVPYGPKSKNTVVEYSIQNTRFLIQQNVKIIIIACNTSSAVAIPYLQKMVNVPVLGVIEAGAKAAVESSKNCRIGVIGTEGTIRSDKYKYEISNLLPEAVVYNKACPLFVSLAEEGWENHNVALQVADEYLKPLLEANIDTLVLGCTHYPILKNIIKKIVGENVKLVDSAVETVKQLNFILPDKETEVKGNDRFYVSDNEKKFCSIAERILSQKIDVLHKVKLLESWFIE